MGVPDSNHNLIFTSELPCKRVSSGFGHRARCTFSLSCGEVRKNALCRKRSRVNRQKLTEVVNERR